MESPTKRKSRDQGFYEFFIILQKEYIVAELRKKIYPDLKGKAKSEEIMVGKKKKIFDIAMKNNLKTIFQDMKLGEISLYDEKLRTELYRDVYGDNYPNFIYRDSVQEERLAEKDKKCYYAIGSEMNVHEVGVGTFQDVDFEKNICWVKVNGKINQFTVNQVSRVL